MRAALTLVLAFALGSIPTGLWWAKARGVDLRRTGSGNLGATNVYRALGARAGLAVLAIDVLKGVAAVVLARLIEARDPELGHAGASLGPLGLPVAAAAAAVLGHVFSPLAGWRGGKGVATGAGAMLVVAPAATLIALGVFAATVAATRFVSLGSVLGAAALPLAVLATRPDVAGAGWASIAVAAIVIARHRENIQRLLRGTERRFGRSAREPAGKVDV